MKVLILSCNTGGGHNACSAALKTAFEEKGVECDVVDSLKFISAGISKLISKGHILICTKFPAMFDWEYSFVEKHAKHYQKGSAVYRFFSLGSQKLARYVNDGGYDTVVCAHVFSSIQITEARRYCKKPIHTAFIATDYTCSPLVEAGALDRYFIPDERLVDEFVRKGIDRSRIQVSGIPINRNYFSPNDNIAQDGKKRILIMAGSIGCGDIEKVVKMLSKEVNDNTEIFVVCGSNKKMKKRLDKEFSLDERICVYGYAEQVWELLSGTDVYLTKPGGLSTSEAKAMGVPMVLLDMLGACEKYNAAFFSEIEGAVFCKSAAEAAQECLHLLENDSKREKMRDNLLERNRMIPTEFIASVLVGNKYVKE